MSKLIHTIVGARPQFIKAAAVSRAMAKADDLDERIIHTGQHYDENMSDIFFDELGIPAPHHNLHMGGGTHGAMTGRMLEGLEKLFIDETPDMVLIYGDTNSTLAGALAAAKLHIPVAHVEAGLRSFNKKMPEEINRIMADQVSALLLCPTQTGVDNLAAEGITDGVSMIGDVMFDATLHAIEAAKMRSTIVADMGLTGEDFVLSTLHRAENKASKERLQSVIDVIEKAADNRIVVLPLHPGTKKKLAEHGLYIKGAKLIDPVGYIDMHALMGAASLILTDSGGLQKEAYFHRKPCITLRDETEWVETIESGWNRLWTADNWVSPRTEIADYGDGTSGQSVVVAIENYLKS